MMWFIRDIVERVAGLVPRSHLVFWWTDVDGDRYGHDIGRGETKVIGSGSEADIRITRPDIRGEHLEIRCDMLGHSVSLSPSDAVRGVYIEGRPAMRTERLPIRTSFHINLTPCVISAPLNLGIKDSFGRYHEPSVDPEPGMFVGLAHLPRPEPFLTFLDVLKLCEDTSRSFVATSDNLDSARDVVLVVRQGKIHGLYFAPGQSHFEVLAHILRHTTYWTLDNTSVAPWQDYEDPIELTPEELFAQFHRRYGGHE